MTCTSVPTSCAKRGGCRAGALLLGLSLTLLMMAGAAHLLLGFDWRMALLIGAVLAPTDPVLAAAVVNREGMPASVRRLLNLESGLNDGLALPIVLLLRGLAAQPPRSPGVLLAEVLGGVALGLAVPRLAHYLVPNAQRVRASSRPLYALALGLLLHALASLTTANQYLAAFVAGSTIATVSPDLRDSYQPLREHVVQVFKLAALLAFGAMLHPARLLELQWQELALVAFALFVARPGGLLLTLLGSSMPWSHSAVAAWFGPKGFASLLYAMLVLHAGLPQSERLYELSALVIAVSIVLHSSTDVPLGRRLARSVSPPTA